MADTFTSKFRLCKPEVGSLDWHILYYDAMDIIDAHVPRVFMSAPRIITSEPTVGGTLTENWYYFYKVLAMNGTLTTLPSWENISIYTDAVNKTGDITWTAVAGATKYYVYRADTNDPSYIPIDSDYNYLAEVVGTTAYSDTGGVVPSGAMPSVVTWYTTEIDQLYVMPDVTEGQTAHVSPVTLIDNLDNIRNMVHQINGQTNWDDTVVTNLYKLQNGLSGGQQITGGIGASENLTLRSTAHATKGAIVVDSAIAGSALASGNLTLRSTTNATKGTIFVDSDLSIPSIKKLYLDGGSDTYIYERIANEIDFVTGGNIRVDIGNTYLELLTGVNIFLQSTSKLYLDGGSDTYIYEKSANLAVLAAGGVEIFQANTTQFSLQPSIDLIIASTKKLYLDGGSNTYIYESAGDNISFVTNAVSRMLIGVSSVQIYQDIHLNSGKQFYLDGGSDTYIVEGIANTIALYTGGAVAMTWTSNQDIVIGAAKKIFFDGGYDTYIYQYADGVMRGYVNNVMSIQWSPTYFYSFHDIIVEAAYKLRLDGNAVGDTYIYENVANSIVFYAGGYQQLYLNASYSGFNYDLLMVLNKKIYFNGYGGLAHIYGDTGDTLHVHAGLLKLEFGTEAVYGSGNTFYPIGAGTVHLGNPTNYWGEVNYKSLVDRGCLGCFDDGVELNDGRIVSDLEALCFIQKHPTKLTVYDKPMLDYSTFPKVSYQKAPTEEGTDGVEMTSMFSIFIGAFKELSQRMDKLEKKVFKTIEKK